ncbi:MAG: hypothetical protein KGI36_06500 [Burkholderiales bacterium]|nr:hypothetical protein [Burkholderiales bacterium]
MNWQALVTALIVVLCVAYAGWSLAPAALRRRVAARLGRPLPAAGGCAACGACGAPPKPPVQVIKVWRRPRADS